jgi:methylated-DNA-protein-cysteine methyltransferase-like protein
MPISDKYRAIYAVVSQIPQGRVATYGQIAQLAGLPGHARLAGYALSALEDKSSVPWHRVVNAAGGISARSDGSPADTIQRLRLEDEGVHFNEHGRIRLDRFQWRPELNFQVAPDDKERR